MTYFSTVSGSDSCILRSGYLVRQDSGQLVDLDESSGRAIRDPAPSSQVCYDFGLKHLIPLAELVPERPPAMTEVMFPPKQFDLATLSLTSQDALNHVVQFVGFAGRFAHFGEQDLGVEAAVEPTSEARGRVGRGGGTADGDEAVLVCVGREGGREVSLAAGTFEEQHTRLTSFEWLSQWPVRPNGNGTRRVSDGATTFCAQSRLTSPDQTLQLIRLDPNELINPFVSGKR